MILVYEGADSIGLEPHRSAEPHRRFSFALCTLTGENDAEVLNSTGKSATTNLAYHRARWMDSRVGRFTGMDPFKGYHTLPQTLHKYAYGVNEPVDRTDPSGRVSPIELVIGNEVHKAIYADFLDKMSSRNGTAYANSTIATIVGTYVSNETNFWTKLAYGASYAARPDLAFRPNQGAGILNARTYGWDPFIFEIKPEGLADVAAEEVELYLSLLDQLDARRDWLAGTATDYTPPPEVDVNIPAIGDIQAQVALAPNDDGVILYTVDNTDTIRANSLLIAASAAVTGIAGVVSSAEASVIVP
jgi:RHS repeat-associated protein